MLTKWIYSNQIHESIVSGISAIYKKIRNFMNFNATKKSLFLKYPQKNSVISKKSVLSIVSAISIFSAIEKKNP